MAEKRIIELANEKLLLSDGDMTIVDSEDGTFKYDLNRLMQRTITDTALTVEGKPADAKAVGDALAEVSVDTVNNARQLLSESYVLDQEPYLFRASGGDGADRVEECIVGGTVGWNQLAEITGFTSPLNGVTFTVNEDDSVTVNGTATGGAARWSGYKAPVTPGHVYYAQGCPANGSFSTYCMYSSYLGSTIDSGSGRIMKAASNADYPDGHGEIFIADGYTANNLVFKPQYIDLTTLFGPTIADYIYSLEQSTAGAGVAYFRKLFPEDYYAYSAPTLKHVEGVSAKQVTGWNQWDEEWEVGGISTVDGSKYTDANRIRSKNYIPVLPNTTYYFCMPNGSGSTVYGAWKLAFYDGSKSFISLTTKKNETFTTPSNCHYLMIGENTTDYGTTYNHDICISLSDPTRNGQYAPYHKNIYPLDSTLTLRGIPKLTDGKVWFDGDKYNADGTVERRYGIVDLGTLTWTRSGDSPSGGNLFVTSNLLASNGNQNVLCDHYVTSSVTNPRDTPNGALGFSSNNKSLYIRDDAYSDADSFKTAVTGKYAVYELATPTTEQATPYTALQLLDPNGTEEFVTTGIVPVGHYSKYLENLRAKIEGLPKDFSTLIAPTEATYKATRNYTTGDLLIVDNILYKATANIANGGTITPNTNVTATTLAAVIAALA